MSTLLRNDEERALRDSVQSFLDRRVAPQAAQHERDRTLPWELMPQLCEFGYVREGVLDSAGEDELPMMMVGRLK